MRTLSLIPEEKTHEYLRFQRSSFAAIRLWDAQGQIRRSDGIDERHRARDRRGARRTRRRHSPERIRRCCRNRQAPHIAGRGVRHTRLLQRCRYVETARSRRDDCAGDARTRERRHPREQCRHPTYCGGPRIPARPLGCDPRHQPLRRVLGDPGGPAADGEPPMGAHHQYCVRSRARRIGAQGRLCRGQAWTARAYQGRRPRDGDDGRDLQCNLPRLGPHSSGSEQIYDIASREGLSSEAAAAELLGEKQPSLEFATPEQMGALAVFLCSDAAAQIRGAAIPVDGGWTAQ